jgi:hypothetical protein
MALPDVPPPPPDEPPSLDVLVDVALRAARAAAWEATLRRQAAEEAYAAAVQAERVANEAVNRILVITQRLQQQ